MLSIVCALLCISCEEDSSTTDRTTFEGITKVDINGQLISEDKSDWTFQESWNSRETALFVEAKQPCVANNNSYIIAYPNPCKDAFAIRLENPLRYIVSYRIVDNNFNVLRHQDSVSANNLYFDIDDLKVTNGMVRVYYKFSGQECELKGHGDIQIGQ